jgi:hypothetical protein
MKHILLVHVLKKKKKVMTKTNNSLFKDLYEEAWKLVRCSFLLTLSFSPSTFSFFSHDFKCFIPKDSNIAGFTFCADRGKASRSYKISIVFTYAASIVCTSPFRGCW